MEFRISVAYLTFVHVANIKEKNMRNILLSMLLILSVAMPAGAMTDREIIAMVIAAEAAGEGVEGMRLVAEVVRNRAKNGNYIKVVTAKNQFYGYTAKNRHKLYKSVKAQADKIVNDMYAGKLGNETNGALYFRRPDEPMFRWCKVQTYSYKSHIFYR
jgi:spore germination cell wall hydrolase CwlJ-like protein